MPVTLYNRQKKILDFVNLYIAKHGTSPTLVEIASAMRLSSLATVHEHLAALARKGVIRRLSGVARGIEVLQKDIGIREQTVDLPLFGFIAAGSPIEPYIDPGATIPISPFLLSGKARAYTLQVKGQSMIEDGILDGDYVVLEETREAKNGDIVVALIDGEIATLKRIYFEKDRVKLAPANSAMKPIYARSVTVQGKVVGLIRKY